MGKDNEKAMRMSQACGRCAGTGWDKYASGEDTGGDVCADCSGEGSSPTNGALSGRDAGRRDAATTIPPRSEEEQ